MSLRTVVIRFPDGESKHWFTDRQFAAGDKLSHDGQAWIIADVSNPNGDDSYTRITLHQDGRSPPT